MCLVFLYLTFLCLNCLSHIEDNMVSRVQRCPFLLPSPPGPYFSFLVPLLFPNNLLGVVDILGVDNLLGANNLLGIKHVSD